MSYHLSGHSWAGHIHMPHVHAIHMHPAHWRQNHPLITALFLTTVIALLFVWITARMDINSVPSYLRRINSGAWYLFGD